MKNIRTYNKTISSLVWLQLQRKNKTIFCLLLFPLSGFSGQTAVFLKKYNIYTIACHSNQTQTHLQENVSFQRYTESFASQQNIYINMQPRKKFIYAYGLCTSLPPGQSSCSGGYNEEKKKMNVKTLCFSAVLSNNRSCDSVFNCPLKKKPHFFPLCFCSKRLNLSVALPGSWFMCTNANGIQRLVAHSCLMVHCRTVADRLDPAVSVREESEGPRQAALALFTTKSHCLMWPQSRLQSSCSHRMCSG